MMDLCPENSNQFSFYDSKGFGKITSDIAIIDRDFNYLEVLEADTIIGFGGHVGATCLSAHEPERRSLIENGYKNIRVVGSPRLDVLHGSKQEHQAIRMIYLRYSGLHEDRRTVLYSTTNIEQLSKRIKIIETLAQYTQELELNLIISMSMGVSSFTNIAAQYDHVGLVDSSQSDFDLVPLLIASDLLITDCSYVAIDYLNLDRPIVFTIANSQQMPKWFKKLVPGKKVFNIKQLKWAIKQFTKDKKVFEEDARNKFIKWFVPYNDNRSCERVVNAIMEIHK